MQNNNIHHTFLTGIDIFSVRILQYDVISVFLSIIFEWISSVYSPYLSQQKMSNSKESFYILLESMPQRQDCMASDILDFRAVYIPTN